MGSPVHRVVPRVAPGQPPNERMNLAARTSCQLARPQCGAAMENLAVSSGASQVIRESVRPHRQASIKERVTITPIFTPDNEPYLGNEYLLMFDQEIPEILREHGAIAPLTRGATLTPLQEAAIQIIPHAVSIALGTRELIRQGYLYPAAVLLRPLVERVALLHYFIKHPSALDNWHSGWPRKTQPSFAELLGEVHEDTTLTSNPFYRNFLHKLVHPDPAGAALNSAFTEDERMVYPSSKILNHPEMCTCVAVTAWAQLRLLRAAQQHIFSGAAS